MVQPQQSSEALKRHGRVNRLFPSKRLCFVLLPIILLLQALTANLEFGFCLHTETRFIAANEANDVCSPRVANMTVLFVQLTTMDQFNDNDFKILTKGGENYVFASLDWALQKMGVTVVYSIRPLWLWTVDELRQYDRIFGNSLEWASVLDEPSIRCKYRPLHYWGNFVPTDPSRPFDHRQILSPYPETYNTFVGYFVHDLLHMERYRDTDKPGKQGLLVGKVPHLFSAEHHHLIQALIEDGFTLYSTCQAAKHCGLPQNVIIPPKMGPHEYSQLAAQMHFLIGFGDPVISPSPLVGLAHGASWLNPYRPNTNLLATDQLETLHFETQATFHTQHNPLALLGAPYVYNIHLDNITQVLAAANQAVNYRFDSFTPADFRPESMIARVCELMQDNSLCECHLQAESNRGLGCRGTRYIRNPAGVY